MKWDKLFESKKKATEVSLEAFLQRFGTDFPTVNLAINEDGVLFRTDTLHKREVKLQMLIPQLGYLPLDATQIDALLRVSHPNLAQIIEILHVKAQEDGPSLSDFQVIVEAVHKGDSLQQLIDRDALKNQEDQFRVLRGMMNGIGELHEKGIIHANLHPTNILIQDVGHIHVVMSGYGALRDWTLPQLRSNMPIQRVRYLSPEQIMPQRFGIDGQIGYNSDLWSMATIMYEVMTRKPLIKGVGSSITEHANAVVASELIGVSKWPIHPNAAALEACLFRDSSKRLQNITQFKQLLEGQHAWKNGKLERIAAPNPAPAPPPAAPKPKVCPHCKAENRPQDTLCFNCDMPLGGPASLKAYHTSLVWGIIMVAFAFLMWLPVGVADWMRLKLQEVEHWELIQRVIAAFDQPSDDEQKQRMLAALAAWTLFALICLFLINLFRTIWLSVLNNNARAFWPGKSVLSGLAIWGCFVADSLAIFTAYGAPVIWLLTSIYRFQAYQAVWKASNRDFSPATSKSWNIAPMSALLLAWGLTGLLTPFLLALHLLPQSIDFVIDPTWTAVAGVLSASYWLMGVVVVIRLAIRQRRKFERMAQG